MPSKKLTQLTIDTPDAASLMYFVKDPNGTPADRACTVSSLAKVIAPPAGGSASLPSEEIAFGTGTGIGSSPELKLVSTTGFGKTPGLLVGVNPDSHAYKLAIGGTITGEDRATALKLSVHVQPASNSTHIIGLNSEVFGDDGASGLTDKSVEMYGGYIEVTALSTNGASGIRGLHVAIRSGIGASLDAAVGIEIGTALGGATVTDVIGLRIMNVVGGNQSNKAIVTGTGTVEFGDNVECLAGLKVAKLAGIGTRAVVVDADGNLSAP